MKIRIPVLCFAVACLAAVPPASAEDDGTAEMRAFKDEIIREINAQRAAYREDLRMRDRQLAELGGELQAWSDYATGLQDKLKRLESQQQNIARGSQQLMARLAENIEVLNQRIETETKSRDAADRKLAETVMSLLVARTALAPTPAPAPVPDTGQPEADDRIYTVAKGDTLSAIALAFNSSVATIKERNSLESDLIIIGQKLYIPELAP
ncbi:MAG: LysM peptidoglycan-binding domain-containing protein [Lentisphaeria bacterium]|jgi:LysM repeat protein|nr:LysM peptidoglycan-binding domain-containing protein [Lentisphaeria bacterium]MDP7743250.1 LysM peptidoglycan-binding domain-containing protein [Lentisphaeria bacterium]